MDPFISHPLRSLVLLPAYQSKKGSKEGARRKCSVCAAHGKRHNAHYYCEACSDISNGSLIVICGHQSERALLATPFIVEMHPKCTEIILCCISVAFGLISL